jgi:TonB family protein
MVKPLRSDNPAPPNMQFTHFGTLNDGSQSRSSLFSSIAINILIAIIVIIISAVVKKTITPPQKVVTLVEPLPIKKPEPTPKIIKMPPPLPKPPVIKPEPPKIQVPEAKIPEPKIPTIRMTHPVPVVIPAPPKRIQPPPAPRVVHLGRAMPASVVNNSPHPSAVSLGRADNPIAPSNRPAVSSVNLGQRGLAGMPASNSGMGPAAKSVNLGSGSAGSQDLNGRDNASRAVRGVRLGVANSNGPMNSHSRVAGVVNLGRVAPPPETRSSGPTYARSGSAPKVLYKPRPQYTAEAIKQHVEGTVSVRLRVSSTGAVQVLGVTRDLGYGLGESAIRAVEGTRFSPATDASGRPVDWEGIVNVAFQLAG